MVKRGCQTRATIAEDGSQFISYDDSEGELIIKDDFGRYELYSANDDYAGYVVLYNGIGHEFIRSSDSIEGLYSAASQT